MSEQLLLQGKIQGIDEFLLSPPGESEAFSGSGEELLAGRSQWITLICEVLPRALLAELGLARILLGSSGGGQFLLILPDEASTAADRFLTTAARDIAAISNGHLKLIWGATENLGDWSNVRKRLNEEVRRRTGTPVAELGR